MKTDITIDGGIEKVVVKDHDTFVGVRLIGHSQVCIFFEDINEVKKFAENLVSQINKELEEKANA